MRRRPQAARAQRQGDKDLYILWEDPRTSEYPVTQHRYSSRVTTDVGSNLAQSNSCIFTSKLILIISPMKVWIITDIKLVIKSLGLGLPSSLSENRIWGTNRGWIKMRRSQQVQITKSRVWDLREPSRKTHPCLASICSYWNAEFQNHPQETH